MASLLIITVLLPLVGSLILFLLPGLGKQQARTIALGTVLATIVLTIPLIFNFKSDIPTPQFAIGPANGPYGVTWMEQLNVRFALGLDGISLWLFALTSLLMVTSVFASWESITERVPTHYALLLALQTGLLGLFSALDVVLFYIFFEFTLIPLFFLIGLYGGPERRRASITFFLYTLAGSLLTLLGVIALVAVNYLHSPGGKLTFSIPELTQGLATLQWNGWFEANSWASPQVLIFLLLFAGFAIKVPMFPFHTWLPLAHVEAPTAGSILLAGVMLKVGGYGLFRFNLGMTPLGAEFLSPWLIALSVIGIIYGALAALAQTDVKRLVAYSSVSHMGFIVLGLFAMNGMGIDGSMIQMINHGLTTGALFACVGVIYERYHTREMSELGGLWNRLPLWAFFFILASLGSAALPGLNGFVGEFPILLGMYEKNELAASISALGMILGAYYLLWMLQRVVFGPLKEPEVHEPVAAAAAPASTEPTPVLHQLPGGETGHGDAHHDDDHAHGHGHTVRPLGWHEIAGLTPLMVFIVLIGVTPKWFFNVIRPSVRPALARIDEEKATESKYKNQPVITPAPAAAPGGAAPAPGGGGRGRQGGGGRGPGGPGPGPGNRQNPGGGQSAQPKLGSTR